MLSHMSVARTAPSALRSATPIPPRLLPVCCACGLIREETKPPLHRERWVSPRTYRHTHGVNSTKMAMTHTYCPTCFMKVQKDVLQYLKTIGTPS